MVRCFSSDFGAVGIDDNTSIKYCSQYTETFPLESGRVQVEARARTNQGMGGVTDEFAMKCTQGVVFVLHCFVEL